MTSDPQQPSSPSAPPSSPTTAPQPAPQPAPPPPPSMPPPDPRIVGTEYKGLTSLPGETRITIEKSEKR